jgi:hypothetical protein
MENGLPLEQGKPFRRAGPRAKRNGGESGSRRGQTDDALHPGQPQNGTAQV